MSRHSFSWIQGTLLAALERLQRKCSGYLAVWPRDSRRLERYTSVRLALASVVLCGVPNVVVAAAPTGSAAVVQLAMDETGVDRGVCCVLGFDVEAALKLVRAGDFLIHLLDPDPEVVAQIRQTADQAGLDIDRVVAEQGGLSQLPQADNVVDLLVAMKITDDNLARLQGAEVLRVLRSGGVAVVGSTDPYSVSARFADKLKKWARIDGTETLRSPLNSVVVLRKRAPRGIDSWTHWEHGPDNNPVSEDQVIKAPYMTQFMAEPFYIGMPSITTAAGGRTFLATGHIAHHRREWDMINQLIARNGYNGTSPTTPTPCFSMAR